MQTFDRGVIVTMMRQRREVTMISHIFGHYLTKIFGCGETSKIKHDEISASEATGVI
jgi:hypothetical protein